MGKAGLSKKWLTDGLKELREADMENQRIALGLGKISGIDERSDGGLLLIAIDFAIKELKKESQEMIKEYETGCKKR